ncbi:hypothetical protein MKJ04_20520 [Pontibacter sp. E15-1]|uniref:DUF6565 domain-containing protein n=1 Tax=Pontibacter sp. E15-1 TaxID=2919918 RepID=UPI001F4F7291|nr:DUF6565 domain-containing protein [Pontibacter sp. E15-1]MCJ8167237.1 hypothetical protein [Pontibacter sp. E15-1]
MDKLIRWILVLLLAAVTVEGAQAQTKVEQDLAELRTWMQRRSAQADSTIRQEWPNVKQEYRELTYGLNQNSQKLSESSRKEYDEMKHRYKGWEERNESEAVDLDGEELERWERQLAGTTHISRLKPVKMRDAYVQLLEQTRERRREWSLRDWEYAEFVYGELNNRRNELQDQLSSGDKIKIAALQVEFASLKKGREAREAYETMREKNR